MQFDSSTGRMVCPRGTWRFKEPKTALDFFAGDWLPNFLAGTITADPGHPALKPRELTYFRLVTIEPV